MNTTPETRTTIDFLPKRTDRYGSIIPARFTARKQWWNAAGSQWIDIAKASGESESEAISHLADELDWLDRKAEIERMCGPIR